MVSDLKYDISVVYKTTSHVPARQNIRSKIWKNTTNQLVTQNQYHFMFYTCSICLCWPNLSLIFLHLIRKIIFENISCYYFEFQKKHSWRNKTLDWKGRTYKKTPKYIQNFHQKILKYFPQTGSLKTLISCMILHKHFFKNFGRNPELKYKIMSLYRQIAWNFEENIFNIKLQTLWCIWIKGFIIYSL